MTLATLTQEPQAPEQAPDITGGDVVRGMLRALKARDTAADDAQRQEAGRALVQGADLLRGAMFAGGDRPEDVNLRAGAGEIVRALDFEAWREENAWRFQRVRRDLNDAVERAKMPVSTFEMGQDTATVNQGLIDNVLARQADWTALDAERQRRSAGLPLFRPSASIDDSGALPDDIATDRGYFGGTGGKLFVRPELAGWRVKLDDPDSLYREALSRAPIGADRTVETNQGPVKIPELDEAARDSIKEALLGINPWSPHALSALREGMGFMRAAGDRLHDALVPESMEFEGRIRNVPTAEAGFNMPFLPNLSGGDSDSTSSSVEDANQALSIARLKDPAWARAVREEVNAQVEGGLKPSTLDVVLGSAGMALDFLATTGAVKAAGANAAKVAIESGGPRVQMIGQTAKAFGEVANASRAGGGFIPTGLTGTAEMVAYENMKAAVTGENFGEATTRGMLLGAGATLAGVLARPVTRVMATAWSKTGLPGSRAVSDALNGLPNADAYWSRLTSLPSQQLSIRELVASTTRNARWAQHAMHWADSYMIGSQFGAWEAARAEAGESWDSMRLVDKAVAAARQLGSPQAVGSGLGFASVGMLYAGATHTKANPNYAKMTDAEKGAVDRMTQHLHERVTKPQSNLEDWQNTVLWFERYRQQHPEEFAPGERPKAPEPAQDGLKQAESLKGARYEENRQRRENFRAQAPQDFDNEGEPTTARATEFWERNPTESRGTARLAEVQRRFMPAAAEAVIGPDGPSYRFNTDLTGSPEFYAMPKGPYAIRRAEMSGEAEPGVKGPDFRVTGWVIVHGEGSGERFGQRVQNTGAYADPSDAMAVASAIAIRNRMAPRYATQRGQNLPGDEPPEPPSRQTKAPFGGGPSPAGPVAPVEPGTLTPTDATAPAGQRRWAVTPEQAQAVVDAHHTDPDKAGLAPIEVVQKTMDADPSAARPEALREHELRTEAPKPAGTPGANVDAIEDGRAGRAPIPSRAELPTPPEGARLETPERVRTADIQADPQRFQFKADTTGAEGVRELDVAEGGYDPRKAGIVTIWQDNAGQDWIVNGHHRLARAKRAGAETMLAWRLREADGVSAEEARALGAVDNIADGKGTATDFAKVMRDLGWSPADLRAHGINTKQGLVRQALGLRDLTDPVFSQVVNGALPENYAAIIGRELPRQEGRQLEAANVARKLNNEDEVAVAVRNIKQAASVTTTSEDLFGGMTQERSLAAERAQVEVAIARRLKSERGLFNTLANRAGTAQRLPGNKVDVGASEAEAKGLNDLLDTMTRLGASKGPVSDALNEAAGKLASGEPIAAVTAAAIERLGKVDWRAGAEQPRPVPASARAEAQEGVRAAEHVTPEQRVAQADASATKAFNILRDAGLIDPNSREQMADFSRTLDALVRGDDAILIGLQMSGAFADAKAATAAYADAQRSARDTRTYLQQAAFDLARGNKPEQDMLRAYFDALQLHADTGAVNGETLAAMKKAGLADAQGNINREATRLLGEWIELKQAKTAQRNAPAEAKLPKDLAGAKPRYGYKNANFELEFASDVDRALYIVGQEKKSARDADYRAFLRQQGFTDESMEGEASLVRTRIKELAKEGASQAEPPKTLKLPGRPRGANAGFTVNPALAFVALARGVWQTFAGIDSAVRDESQWLRFARVQKTIDRLNPFARSTMDAKVAANQPFMPRSLLGLVSLYNKLGGQWSNTVLPTAVRDMQRDVINDVLRARQAESANLIFQVEDLFAQHLTWDGRRVDRTDIDYLYEAVDSGRFRSMRSEQEWVEHAGEARRYLYPFMLEITRLSNAILDRGVALGRFDPRQADKMRSRWIPKEYLSTNRELNVQSLVNGQIAPVIDRHSVSRTASSEDNARLLHMDPAYLWQRGLRQEERTNTFLQVLSDMRAKGHAMPFESMGSSGPGTLAYQRALFETAALGDLSGATRMRDPVNGAEVAGRQVRFAQVLRNVLTEMQSKESFERGEPALPGQRAFSAPLHDLMTFYLGPEHGRPDRYGVVKPGAYIPEGIGRELDWMVDALLPRAEASPFQEVWGLGVASWRRNVTVHSYPHWITNQVSNAFLNWGAGRLPITDYVSSLLWGRGHFADAMRDGVAWQTFMQHGKQPWDGMRSEEWDAAQRFERTANQLHGGLFINTVVKRGALRGVLGAGIEPDQMTSDLRAQLARRKGVTGHERAELEAAIADWGRRVSVHQGGYERMALELLGSRNATGKINAAQALHGQYGVWELLHKHAATMAQLEKHPNLSHEQAAVWAAQGTVDYGDTSPMIRNAYNDPSARRSLAYYQTESNARAKQLARYVLANPFALFFAGGVPRWTADMVRHPARSMAVLAAGAGISAALWAALAAASGEDQAGERLFTMGGSRGFEGMPTFRPEEAQAFAEGNGYNAVGAEGDLPQSGLTRELAFALQHAPGTAPAPGGMVSDVGKMVPQFDMAAGAVTGVANARGRSSGDNILAAADAILGLNVGFQTSIVAGVHDYLTSDQARADAALQKSALDALRRTMPQTGDWWWASRGGQDAIGSALGMSLQDMLTAMPAPNRDAGERAAQATWRFFWNARSLRPYSGWKDTRDLSQVLAQTLGLKGGDSAGESSPDRMAASRMLASWAPRSVAVTYQNYRSGKYAEPATFDSLLAWQFGLAHDLRTDVPDIQLVDDPQTPIGQFVQAQMKANPAVGAELLDMAFKYVHGPSFSRGVAPILDLGRGRAFDPMLVEEAFRSSAKDQTGAGLLKMTLALAKSDPEKRGQAWALYRNLPAPPDPRSPAGMAYAELQSLFDEERRGITYIPPVPNLLDTFGSQAFQGGLPAVQTINAQGRIR